MTRKKFEEKAAEKKEDMEQMKKLAAGLLVLFNNKPAKCPECGKSTKNKWRITIIRREYPDPDGFDAVFGCEICGAYFCDDEF